jgi:type I restriction enzyme S subunit
MEMLDIEVFDGGFKETELGPLPEEWEVVRLGEVIKYYTPSKKLKQSDYKTFGKFPVIDQGQKYIAGFYDDETMVFDKDLPVILFGDHTRIIKYVDFPFICGAEGLKIIVPKENFHRKYFYYALLNLNIPSRGYNRHFKILIEKFIPLPPLEEQQKIAQILQSIDQRIEKEEKYKNALQNLFKSLLHNLMTGKIRVRVKDHGED